MGWFSLEELGVNPDDESGRDAGPPIRRGSCSPNERRRLRVLARAVFLLPPDRDELLKKRGIDRDAFDRVAAHQWSVEQKVSTLESVVARDQFGSVVAYENSLDPERSARGIEHLATHVREILHLKERS